MANDSGRPLGFRVTAGAGGKIVLAGGYGALIGVLGGELVQIQHVGNSLIVHAAGVVPVFRDEPVPAPGEGVTYDDAGEG